MKHLKIIILSIILSDYLCATVPLGKSKTLPQPVEFESSERGLSFIAAFGAFLVGNLATYLAMRWAINKLQREATLDRQDCYEKWREKFLQAYEKRQHIVAPINAGILPPLKENIQ